ncbi:15900_t:CDS:2 [Acaulospora morrowiae]|uniref:15900_t:CDS:1 n=1 Tax=Acaulospora morrowiae TaxID=94023 RepID=A0A9N8ZAJ3_9GLOM|nr:15900_t:CDS:2 [Acaulospora morrowiae]
MIPGQINASLEGLRIIEDFINKDEELELINALNSNAWCGRGIARRTQHYGYEFSYRYRKIMRDLGPLPDFMDFIIQRLVNQEIIRDTKDIPNMCIVNEYDAGQGIMPHTDSATLFGPVITSLSLLSPCLMKFTHASNLNDEAIILLRPRSLLIMTGSSRYDYKHTISKDLVEGFEVDGEGILEIVRSRRISLTFRTITSCEEGCNNNDYDGSNDES